MNVIVRPAQPADYVECAQMLGEFHAAAGRAYTEFDLRSAYQTVEGLATAPFGTVLVAETDGRLIYEPANCRWETPKTQARNRRNGVMVHYEGKDVTVAELCEITGISMATIKYRMKVGRSDILKYGIRRKKVSDADGADA